MAYTSACLKMDNEEFYMNSAFDDYEDSSSGYDSTDLSDTESSASDESSDIARASYVSRLPARDSYVNLLPAGVEDEEYMHFQSTGDLCENLKLILSIPDMCDITFLVGPREIPVHGVRAILATRSRVFYQLILKKIAEQQQLQKLKLKKKSKKSIKKSVGIALRSSEKLVIPVKKYDSEVFRLLVQFIHCGSVNITENTVAGLFCGAKQFDLPDLATACMDFIGRCLEHGRTEQMLSSARTYSHHKASAILFDKIYSVLDRRYGKSSKVTGV